MSNCRISGPLADGIAAHESAAADDLVGEEAPLARREEVALVPAQAEEREAVVAVRAHEPADEPPLFGGLPDTFGQRPQPEVKRTEPEHEAHGGEHVLDPVAAEPAQVEHDDERCGRRQCKQRDDERTRADNGSPGTSNRFRNRIERREHEQAERGFLEVEALGEMRHGQTDHEDDARAARRADAYARASVTAR